jgi:aminopeptidase-like protein
MHEVPSGTKVFDWTVPPEWNITAHVLGMPATLTESLNFPPMDMMSVSFARLDLISRSAAS